jgi:hypothetical protein
MKSMLIFLLAILACQVERASLRAPEEQAGRELRYLECSPCDLTDPDHRQSPPWRAACEMLAHGVALEDDDDVRDPELRLVRVSDRGGVDRAVHFPSNAHHGLDSGFGRMPVGVPLRC